METEDPDTRIDVSEEIKRVREICDQVILINRNLDKWMKQADQMQQELDEILEKIHKKPELRIEDKSYKLKKIAKTQEINGSETEYK